jgi:hypothetical protein
VRIVKKKREKAKQTFTKKMVVSEMPYYRQVKNLQRFIFSREFVAFMEHEGPETFKIEQCLDCFTGIFQYTSVSRKGYLPLIV